MATRTSHSSPCFLRVAAASAASSASKITSFSTPFSLETASTTIRISLFTAQSPHGLRPTFQGDRARRDPLHLAARSAPNRSCSWRESCLANFGEWHVHHLPVYFNLYACIRHLAEPPRITPTPF